MRMVTLLAIAVLLLAVSPDVTAVADPNSDAGVALGPADESGVAESPDALVDDLRLTAEANGWTVDQGPLVNSAATAVGAIAERVAAEQPHRFVGSAVGSKPGDPPILYIKGPVDEYVRNLVATSDVRVIVAANQPYSFDELEQRKLRIHHALEAMGFSNVATSTNVTCSAGSPGDPGTVLTNPLPDLPGSVT